MRKLSFVIAGLRESIPGRGWKKVIRSIAEDNLQVLGVLVY